MKKRNHKNILRRGKAYMHLILHTIVLKTDNEIIEFTFHTFLEFQEFHSKISFWQFYTTCVIAFKSKVNQVK